MRNVAMYRVAQQHDIDIVGTQTSLLPPCCRGQAQNARPRVARCVTKKRYLVAAGAAQALRDSLPMHDFSIIHDYHLPRDASTLTTFPSFTTTTRPTIPLSFDGNPYRNRARPRRFRYGNRYRTRTGVA